MRGGIRHCVHARLQLVVFPQHKGTRFSLISIGASLYWLPRKGQDRKKRRPVLVSADGRKARPIRRRDMGRDRCGSSESGRSFQNIADEAFADFLKKHKQPVGLTEDKCVVAFETSHLVDPQTAMPWDFDQLRCSPPL